MRDPAEIGVNLQAIAEAARQDRDVAEFERFYLERRDQEVVAAGKDARRQKKMEDDFTPQIETSLVALDGMVQRSVTAQVHYHLDGCEYESIIGIVPSEQRIETSPILGVCGLSKLTVPVDALATCDVSGTSALKHRLVRSDVSGRHALPEHSYICALSGKRLLLDEAAVSDITGAVVDMRLLKICAITGRKGEPGFFGTCAFTKVEVLNEQLASSDVSGKPYRSDQGGISVISGVHGHRSEFITCHETRQSLLPTEADRCEQTGKLVRPGILQPCASSSKRVLPSELENSTVSGLRVLKNLLVQSSVSSARFLESEGVRSAYGKFCAPVEAKSCEWSGQAVHPDDIRTCSLLGLPVHFQFVSDGSRRLQVVEQLLLGTRRTADSGDRWEEIRLKTSNAVSSGRCRIEAAELSPDGKRIAVCAEVKTMLGLRTQHAGMLYSLEQSAILGRIALVKRDAKLGLRS
jgi:hypothetical protein